MNHVTAKLLALVLPAACTHKSHSFRENHAMPRLRRLTMSILVTLAFSDIGFAQAVRCKAAGRQSRRPPAEWLGAVLKLLKALSA